jgi:hypothetical protein
MEAIDYRNAKFADLQDRLVGLRLSVWQAWKTFGPGTTRQVAQRSGIDILSFRPRTTELLQLGLVVLAGNEPGHEGNYRAASLQEAWAAVEAKRGPAQRELSLI